MLITLDDAKAHLNVTTADDDTLIQAKIDAASDWINALTGSSSTDTAPASVKEACRLLVAHLYANREASVVGATAQTLPLGFLDLITPYRAFAF